MFHYYTTDVATSVVNDKYLLKNKFIGTHSSIIVFIVHIKFLCGYVEIINQNKVRFSNVTELVVLFLLIMNNP